MKTNQKLIEDFIKHLEDGMPILRKKQKPICEKTARKIRTYMNKIAKAYNKPLEKVTVEDVKEFREKLKNNILKKENENPYSDSVKRDIEYKIMGKFFKWLGKEDLVYFTDDYNKETEIPALTRREVERMANASKLRDKLIIMLLFDSGARADEFINLKFSDIKEDQREKGYYKLRVRISKTKPRTIPIPLSTEVLDEWLQLHKEKKGTGAKLINITYSNLGKVLTRIGRKVLNKKVYPHLLRHSSCTFYCHKLNQYQLCKRYGWSMASRMPQKYIDREGVDEEETSEVIINDEVGKYKEQVKKLTEELSLVKDQVNESDKRLELFNNWFEKNNPKVK